MLCGRICEVLLAVGLFLLSLQDGDLSGAAVSLGELGLLLRGDRRADSRPGGLGHGRGAGEYFESLRGWSHGDASGCMGQEILPRERCDGLREKVANGALYRPKLETAPILTKDPAHRFSFCSEPQAPMRGSQPQ